ncbi:hypothetical protein QZH56_13180 [Streptomyces olivoreticuli]|nr:hypothetical protein [Streptomyces olivoreticuli]WKK26451.1 hypothetical protein QZH56_13180 [Streptomyces olivoreticuli]
MRQLKEKEKRRRWFGQPYTGLLPLDFDHEAFSAIAPPLEDGPPPF